MVGIHVKSNDLNQCKVLHKLMYHMAEYFGLACSAACTLSLPVQVHCDKHSTAAQCCKNRGGVGHLEGRAGQIKVKR